MRILLTGGAGFIGSHLAQQLLNRGEDLSIVDNLDSFYDPGIKLRNLEQVRKMGNMVFYEADLLQREPLQDLFRRHRPQTVIHLAALAGVRPSLEKPIRYTQYNVMGTVNLLELCREHEVEHFIFASSSSVYGSNSKVPFHEDDPISLPISPYAATKRAGELMCQVYTHNYGLAYTCLRFFTVYGPRQRPEMAIHKFTRKIQRGKEISVYHKGESKRDYTYIDDILQGLLAALDRPSGSGIVNLGNSHPVKLLDLIQLIEDRLGMRAKLRLLPAQPGDISTTYADISKAKELLGYCPRTPIKEGIRRFVGWYLDEMV